MVTKSIPDAVTTELGTDTVSATGIVDASPSDVFAFVRRPANHAQISGDHSVRGSLVGPDELGPESRFGMKMKGGVPYRTKNKVVEFDEDRVIAWCHLAGHRWRWELQPTADGKTRLTETFDMSTGKVPFLFRRLGYPKGHLANVANSVANVAAHFAPRSTATTTGSERVAYEEFGYFADNAAEYGVAYAGPPSVRRVAVAVAPARQLSALVWGDGPSEYVLLHGGAQNAHTWDTVALALGRPLVAIDLPGHGHSDAAAVEAGEHSAEALGRDIAIVIAELAPDAKVVVGMSLGGLTAIVLAAARPELVRRLALIDITPGVSREKAKAITDFVRGPATFQSFDELLARTIEHNPTRTESSLRRGILHNAVQLDDGSWMWRYRRHGDPLTGDAEIDASARMWDALGGVTAPVLLVRGMRPQSVVDDDDEAELLRRIPSARVEHFDDAGHSVQGDMPVELAATLADFAGTDPS